MAALAGAVVDDLNPSCKHNGLRSILPAESVCVAVKPCYLPVPFLTGNLACCHWLMPPLKLRTL